MATQSLSTRDVVLLHTPDNPTFDGLLAIVEEPTDYGARVIVKAWTTDPSSPGRRVVGEFSYRASYEEMDYIGTLPPEGGRVMVREVQPQSVKPTSPHVHRNGKPFIKKEETGKYCPNCGGAKLVRTGSCETCQDCGHNEGCG